MFKIVRENTNKESRTNLLLDFLVSWGFFSDLRTSLNFESISPFVQQLYPPNKAFCYFERWNVPSIDIQTAKRTFYRLGRTCKILATV